MITVIRIERKVRSGILKDMTTSEQKTILLSDLKAQFANRA
jgi:hypothetical protein